MNSRYWATKKALSRARELGPQQLWKLQLSEAVRGEARRWVNREESISEPAANRPKRILEELGPDLHVPRRHCE